MEEKPLASSKGHSFKEIEPLTMPENHKHQDEWANWLTHAIGLVLSLVGFFLLISRPIGENAFVRLLALGTYGMSLVLLYGTSALYHVIKHPEKKRFLRMLDHCAIYLLIAGSYTPFTLISLKGIWGWTLFGAIWSLAFLGIIFKIFFVGRFLPLSIAIYLAMGWLVVLAARPMMEGVQAEGLFLVLVGGLIYTFGVLFYLLDKIRFFHAIWHLFVMGGSFCHYLAIFLYV